MPSPPLLLPKAYFSAKINIVGAIVFECVLKSINAHNVTNIVKMVLNDNLNDGHYLCFGRDVAQWSLGFSMAKLERNSMNKSMRILLLATALSGATSGMAFADDISAQSGTLTFNGVLTEGSCVLGGQNIIHDFGTLSKGQPQLTKTPGGGYQAYKFYNDQISVSGCPAEITNVGMVANYTTSGGANNVVVNTSGSENKSNAVMLVGQTLEVGDKLYNNGKRVLFPVVDGGVNIPMVSQVTKSTTTAMTSGDASFDVTLAFDYE